MHSFYIAHSATQCATQAWLRWVLWGRANLPFFPTYNFALSLVTSVLNNSQPSSEQQNQRNARPLPCEGRSESDGDASFIVEVYSYLHTTPHASGTLSLKRLSAVR